jgi:hypothetical protein
MSSQQFINSNNQSLLWKVINNTPQMIHYFATAPPGEKEKWFQYIIGQIYNQYKGQNLSLKDMNKRAIDVMLQVLTPSLKPSLQHQPFNQLKSQSQQSVNDQFSRRQAEYDLMVKKEMPTPHFTENVKDEAIVDLNSAVEAYKRNRNEDADVVIPKPKDINIGLKDAVGAHPSVPLEKLDLSNAQPIEISIVDISQTSQHGSTFDISSRSQQHGISRPDSLLHPYTIKTPTLSAVISEQGGADCAFEMRNGLIKERQVPLKAVQWGNNTEHIFDNNNSIIQNNIETKLDAIEKDIRDIKSKLIEILSKIS